MKKYGLVLGGGAARGLVHIGVIKYIEEQNIEINEISGTSMGAIIAAMFAIGKTSNDMIDFAKSINYLSMGDPDFKIGLLKGLKIEKKLKEVFGDLKIEDCKISLKIVATNLETSKSNIFTKGYIVDIIRASISLPGIFVPKDIGGHLYVDGGIMMNLPIDVLNNKNIIAISALKINKGSIIKTKKILGIDFKTGFFKNNFEIIKRSVILMMKVNEDNSLQTKGKNIKFIRPNFGKLDVIDFNKVDDFVKLGYLEAKTILYNINDNKYVNK